MCQLSQPPRLCRLDGTANPNGHPTDTNTTSAHQPIISPPSRHREAINVWSGRHTSGDCFSKALRHPHVETTHSQTRYITGKALKDHSHEIWIAQYCYFILESVHGCLKPVRSTYGGGHHQAILACPLPGRLRKTKVRTPTAGSEEA